MTKRMPLIIEPEDFVEQLDHSNLVIVDLSRIENFSRAHLPHSHHLDFRHLMCGQLPAAGKVPSEQLISRLINSLGIDDTSWVVALDDEGGGWAGRFLWTLHLVGLRNFSYLNGGLVTWVNEGFPTTSDIIKAETKSGHYTFDSSELIEAETLINLFNGTQAPQIWDARSPQEYDGTQKNAARSGHMPGAINLDWLELMDPSRNLRLKHNIKDLVEAHGLSLDKKTVTHCQSHHRSGLTWLVGKNLNMDIIGYHGSWSEWGNRQDTQVEV